MGIGIRCPECGGETKVIDSRGVEGYVRRRRECLRCRYRDTTREQWLRHRSVVESDQIHQAVESMIRDLGLARRFGLD